MSQIQDPGKPLQYFEEVDSGILVLTTNGQCSYKVVTTRRKKDIWTLKYEDQLDPNDPTARLERNSYIKAGSTELTIKGGKPGGKGRVDPASQVPCTAPINLGRSPGLVINVNRFCDSQNDARIHRACVGIVAAYPNDEYQKHKCACGGRSFPCNPCGVAVPDGNPPCPRDPTQTDQQIANILGNPNTYINPAQNFAADGLMADIENQIGEGYFNFQFDARKKRLRVTLKASGSVICIPKGGDQQEGSYEASAYAYADLRDLFVVDFPMKPIVDVKGFIPWGIQETCGQQKRKCLVRKGSACIVATTVSDRNDPNRFIVPCGSYTFDYFAGINRHDYRSRPDTNPTYLSWDIRNPIMQQDLFPNRGVTLSTLTEKHKTMVVVPTKIADLPFQNGVMPDQETIEAHIITNGGVRPLYVFFQLQQAIRDKLRAAAAEALGKLHKDVEAKVAAKKKELCGDECVSAFTTKFSSLEVT